MRIGDWSSDVCSSDLELGGAVRRVRRVGADGGPEAVDAGDVDQVAAVGGHEQRQEGTAAVVDAAPADAEGPLPRLALVDQEDRKSVVSGTSVSGRLKPGGRRTRKTKTHNIITH